MSKRVVNIFILCLLVLGIALPLTGCSSPYSTKPIGEIKLFQKRNETPLNSDKPSWKTRQYLRLRFLDEQYKQDSPSVIEQLGRECIVSYDMDAILALTELSLLQARKLQTKDPQTAKALYLAASEGAWRYLLEYPHEISQTTLNPSFRFMAEIYKRAVSNLWKLSQTGQIVKSSDAGTFETAGTRYSFSIEPASESRVAPETFDTLIPAIQFQVKGLANEYFSYGLGVPMIGIVNAPQAHEQWGPFFPQDRFTYPVTTLIKFSKPTMLNGKRQVDCKLAFYDPLTTNTFEVNGHEVPLEADFSTALAFQLQKTKPLQRGLLGLVNTDELVDKAGIYLLEPYRPDKIPVLMVHGLMSSPETWVPMFNDLRGQPDLRENYQFWFFAYPTGLPILYSSSILRRELKEIRDFYDPDRTNLNFDNMVLVSHSMGGLLTRMMLVDTGNAFYDAIFDEPFDELPVSDEMRKLVSDLVFFKRQDNIKRVIFIATPHRGSPMADTWYAKFGAGFINLPATITQGTDELLSNQEIKYNQRTQNVSNRIHTSIALLSPTSLFMVEQLKLPLPDDIPYHSIIGIRKAKEGPGSSDGVVPYESSHLDFAQSEKLVPAKHGAHLHPLAIDEVKRILRRHLDETKDK